MKTLGPDNAEVTRQMTLARAAQDEEGEQLHQFQELQRELEASRAALDSLKTTAASTQQVIHRDAAATHRARLLLAAASCC
ncbi:hypothetical protein EYF80_067474 [Liparis tanakae]|uniref:Uncharacterized protein n=1 Tax=Liparis tanakae TaxID=230148 RepID=A0A4Z2E205_9TELE|nr:hypothetical protein EYF80_067474 [Liparis tanakae]